MGCSTSKLDDEEVVQLCKDRRRFIQQAVEQRIRFASGHTAYIQSLKRVAAALRSYVEGDEPREFFLGSYSAPPLTPVKNSTPSITTLPATSFSTPPPIHPRPNSSGRGNSGSINTAISSKSFSAPPSQPGINSSFQVHYMRAGGTPAAVHIHERPPSPETVRVETYASMYNYGIDGFFSMQSSPPSYSTSTPNNRPSFNPPSPPNSQWDFFWNPFTFTDPYAYPSRSSLDHTIIDDDYTGLQQVREEEGIPDLEEEGLEEENKVDMQEERSKVDLRPPDETIVIEDDTDSISDNSDTEMECDHEVKGLQRHGRESCEVSKPQNAVELEVHKTEIDNQGGKEQTPGFTVYVNKRPTSMAEVIKDIETQFVRICNSASEVSTMLEASRAPYASTSRELSAAKMLNPVAIFRSASSRSSSSRFFNNSSSARDEGCESSSDLSEEACMFSGSHQSTLDRLYAWEKKLYAEVKSGERIRLAYEKKCSQLRNQDVKGEDPHTVDKTRATIRDLHTQIKVSIHSVEAVSKRIETLRDDELQPQLLELIQGLARMWKVMAECHQFQKHTVDEAKLLLAGTPLKIAARRQSDIMSQEPNRLAQSAAKLESELRNWRICFEAWITAQRSYIHAITGWLLRCVQCDSDTSKLPFSPRRSNGTPHIFGICIQWSRFLDTIHETSVIDGIDFFAAGLGSLYAQQLKEDSRRTPVGSKRFGAGFIPDSGKNMEMVQVGEEEEVMTPEKTAEVAIRVLCAGMSVSISSLTAYAISSAEGYNNLVKQWDQNAAWTDDARKIEV